jgi:hypothetical protein
MQNRWMAVVLGAAVLAIPGTALAKGDHGKGHGKEKAKSHQEAEKHGKKGKAKKDKAAKGKSFVFKGVYEGEGVVAVASGNGRVRKGGFVGQDVTFDLSAAKLVVADSDGVPGITADDVQAGDKVLVQARLPRGTKAPEPAEDAEASTDDEPAAGEAPAAFKARKLVDLSRPPVSDDDDADDDEAEDEPEHVEED